MRRPGPRPRSSGPRALSLRQAPVGGGPLRPGGGTLRLGGRPLLLGVARRAWITANDATPSGNVSATRPPTASRRYRRSLRWSRRSSPSSSSFDRPWRSAARSRMASRNFGSRRSIRAGEARVNRHRAVGSSSGPRGCTSAGDNASDRGVERAGRVVPDKFTVDQDQAHRVVTPRCRPGLISRATHCDLATAGDSSTMRNLESNIARSSSSQNSGLAARLSRPGTHGVRGPARWLGEPMQSALDARAASTSSWQYDRKASYDSRLGSAPVHPRSEGSDRSSRQP